MFLLTLVSFAIQYPFTSMMCVGDFDIFFILSQEILPEFLGNWWQDVLYHWQRKDLVNVGMDPSQSQSYTFGKCKQIYTGCIHTFVEEWTIDLADKLLKHNNFTLSRYAELGSNFYVHLHIPCAQVFGPSWS